MNYIGSKNKLSPFIYNNVKSIVGDDMSNMTFCDGFAGCGVIGKLFKKHVKQVISNDIEYYSYVLNRNYIENNVFFECEHFIEKLNNLIGVEGFIFNEYSENGSGGRLYFSEYNGKKIDAIREKIEIWKNDNIINENEYFFLLCSLLESVDLIANTASVYASFLKKLKQTAQKKIILKSSLFHYTPNNHKVYNKDINALIKEVSGDVLYLDPPYNTRQYGAYYHLLNTISEYKIFKPKGITGTRFYPKSVFCIPNKVLFGFDFLIKNAKFKYIFLSYNNEGLMSLDNIKNIMSKHGNYSCVQQDGYMRYKADKKENRNYKSEVTTEYLHILEKK